MYRLSWWYDHAAIETVPMLTAVTALISAQAEALELKEEARECTA